MTDQKPGSKRSAFLISFVILWGTVALFNPPKSDEIPRMIGELIASGLIASVFVLGVFGAIWVAEKFEPKEQEAGATDKPTVLFLMLTAFVWFLTFLWFSFAGLLGVGELGWVFLGICVVGLLPKGEFFNRPIITKVLQSKLFNHGIFLWFLKQAPLIPTVLEFQKELTAFYTQNKRKNLLYYYVFPLVIIPALLISPRARAEFKVIMVPVYIVVATLLTLNFVSYLFDYGPHLGLSDLFWISNGILGFCILLTLVVTPALTATTGELLARKQNSTLIVLLLFGTCGLTIGNCVMDGVTDLGGGRHETMQSLTLVGTKLTRPGFRAELAASTKAFLLSQDCQTHEEDKALLRADLTSSYREHLEDLMTVDEAGYYTVVQLSRQKAMPVCHLAVLAKFKAEHLDGKSYEHHGADHVRNGTIVLFIRHQDEVFQTWDRLPPTLKELGGFPKSSEGFEEDGRYLYDGILVRTRAQFALLDEFAKRKTGFGLQLLGRNGIIGFKGTPSDCPESWIADLTTGDCMPPEDGKAP